MLRHSSSRLIPSSQHKKTTKGPASAELKTSVVLASEKYKSHKSQTFWASNLRGYLFIIGMMKFVNNFLTEVVRENHEQR
jgi:hypothetical protein